MVSADLPNLISGHILSEGQGGEDHRVSEFRLV